MKTIDASIIKKQINECYLEYDPEYPKGYGEPTMMNGFKYYLERTAGIRLEFVPETKNFQFGYGMKRVEIVDEKKYVMWLLRWT
jgi:hypothetical protein